MFKSIQSSVFSFDLEWIPDPLSAEILHGVEENTPMSIDESYRTLWRAGGATEEKPQPYIKTILCRIVSVSGVLREINQGKVSHKLVTLPLDANDLDQCKERNILGSLLKALGRKKPQIVGYNSHNADVPIMVQRAIVNGLPSFGFATRPDKPWEGADYFSNFSDWNIDLSTALGRGAQTPSLHEAASLSGIPGKMDVAGGSVPEMWIKGQTQAIIDYNECDAFTTHLLWARMAFFAGLLSDSGYADEQKAIRNLLDSEAKKGKPHLIRFKEEWDRLQKLIQKRI